MTKQHRLNYKLATLSFHLKKIRNSSTIHLTSLPLSNQQEEGKLSFDVNMDGWSTSVDGAGDNETFLKKGNLLLDKL